MSNTTKGTLAGTEGGVAWSYTGDTLNGVPHSKWEKILSDSRVSEGNWVDGEYHER